MSDDELLGCKTKISTISDRLKELRKEVKLCEDIAERSDVIEHNLEVALTDEAKQKSKRKEKSNYEQRW